MHTRGDDTACRTTSTASAAKGHKHMCSGLMLVPTLNESMRAEILHTSIYLFFVRVPLLLNIESAEKDQFDGSHGYREWLDPMGDLEDAMRKA